MLVLVVSNKQEGTCRWLTTATFAENMVTVQHVLTLSKTDGIDDQSDHTKEVAVDSGVQTSLHDTCAACQPAGCLWVQRLAL